MTRDDPSIFIIALQEHWLTPSNLSVLNSVHPDFVSYGISAMGNRLSSAQRLDLFARCVRLSRLLVGFRTHFKSLHFHSVQECSKAAHMVE